VGIEVRYLDFLGGSFPMYAIDLGHTGLEDGLA